jgi:peptidoglycan/xylan/chitin deacetylase (PgdA/CDA1 family)
MMPTFKLASPRRIAWLGALVAGLVLAVVWRAPAEDATAPTDDAGSPAVLAACWTPEQLAGSADMKRSVRRPKNAPRVEPPGRDFNLTSLPLLPVAWRGSIRAVRMTGDDKPLALTFDLCQREHETSGYDAAIVNYLRAHGVRATFFAGGEWMQSHPEQTKQLMADPLFELGNHGWSHGNFALLSAAEMRDQVIWTQAQYERLREELHRAPCAASAGEAEFAKIPRTPRVFRFPYGACRREALDRLAELGLPAVQWDVVTADSVRGRSARQIAAHILAHAQPGSIVVCHANGRGRRTAEALPLVISPLVEKGYRFVTVSELLRAGTPVTTEECYEEKPGDTRRYDRKFGKGTP